MRVRVWPLWPRAEGRAQECILGSGHREPKACSEDDLVDDDERDELREEERGSGENQLSLLQQRRGAERGGGAEK